MITSPARTTSRPCAKALWKLALETQRETMEDAASDASVNPRLYNLDQEIGERTNLAAQHPDIVANSPPSPKRSPPRSAATNPNPAARPAKSKIPSPLSTSDKPKERPAPQGKGQSQAHRPLQLQPGDKLDAENAPHIAGTPFTLTCEVTTAQRDAILIAHGGASTGYALHLVAAN